MPVPWGMQKVVNRLTQRVESPHFIAYYEMSNPERGRRFRPGGVTSRGLVLTYLDALERVYAAMTQSPWQRRPPRVGNEGKTRAYIFYPPEYLLGSDDPFTTVDDAGVAFIGLRFGNDEPTVQCHLWRAAAEAIHEGTHLFNFEFRRPRDVSSYPWVWFHEATAVFVEMLVVSGNPDHFRCIANWVEMPETPVDKPGTGYQNAKFVEYLARCFDVALVNNIWTLSGPQETPLQALSRLLGARRPPLEFASADPFVKDLFASGYCMDSYFLLDPRSPMFAPNVYGRYGGRAISESFVMDAGHVVRSSEMECLCHLGCRYYRFYLKGSAKRFEVRLRTPAGSPTTALKAELAVVTPDMMKGKVVPLTPAPAGESAIETALTATLEPDDGETLDHLVLVVSNCELQAGPQGVPMGQYDDQEEGQKYTIEASAT